MLKKWYNITRGNNMEEKIINSLNRKNKALSIDEIFHLLELHRTEYDS